MDAPVFIACPHCAVRMKIKDPQILGRTVKCPKCGESFAAAERQDAAAEPRAAVGASKAPESGAQSPRKGSGGKKSKKGGRARSSSRVVVWAVGGSIGGLLLLLVAIGIAVAMLSHKDEVKKPEPAGQIPVARNPEAPQQEKPAEKQQEADDADSKLLAGGDEVPVKPSEGAVKLERIGVAQEPYGSWYELYGSHLATLDKREGKVVVSLDGKIVPDFDCAPMQVDHLPFSAFSPFDCGVSADGEHFVYFGATEGNKFAVVRDGVADEFRWNAVKLWPDLMMEDFSPEYFARWVQEPEAAALARVFRTKMFSPDGKRLVYAGQAERDGQFVLVIDGRQLPLQFERVMEWCFSNDSKRFACVVKLRSDKEEKDEEKSHGGRYAVIVDGEVMPIEGRKRSVTDLQFSPDGQHLTYQVSADTDFSGGSETLIYMDGKFLDKGTSAPQWHREDGLVFSPDGQQMAYPTQRVDGSQRMFAVVLNGKRGKEYTLTQDLQFSPDGKHFVYKGVIKDRGTFYVIDGHETSPDYSAVNYRYAREEDDYRRLPGRMTPFSGARFVDGKFLHAGSDMHGRTLFIDGQRAGKLYFNPTKYVAVLYAGPDLFVSPDDKHLAFFATTARTDSNNGATTLRTSLVHDGVASPEIGGVPQPRICTSADYRHWAFACTDRQRAAVAHDDKVRRFRTDPKQPISSIDPMAMSPDGERLAYVMTILGGGGREPVEILFVDEKKVRLPGKPYALLFSPDSRRFACFISRVLPSVAGQGARLQSLVILDGRSGQPFDGDVLARHARFDDAGKLHFIAAKDGNLYRVTQE